LPTLLSVNNYFYSRGGAETVFLEHGRLLAGAGWQVVPFAMHHPRNLPSEWSRYFVDEIEFGGQYSLPERISRAAKVIYSFEARRKLTQLLDVARPDICHAHNIYHHISPSILGLLKERGVPVVLTLHDLKIACPAYTMLAADGICERCKGGHTYNVLVHRCIKGSAVLSAVVLAENLVHRALGSYSRDVARFVVPSRFYATKLQQWGYAAERFRHVPNFVDVANYEAGFQPGQRILYFGRLSPEKGLATLLRAARQAGAPLSLVGTGPQEPLLRQMAEALQLDVEFRGFLSGAELHSAIRAARAVALPSEWYENAPMSVLEAYALGKPLLGARIGGIPELLREDETGWGFDSGNVDSLAQVLRRTLTTPDSRLAGMGRTARAWVAEEFSADSYRKRMLALYRELGVGGTAGDATGD
jgi:glycosyltransferase involved in cell wall biosynthesis